MQRTESLSAPVAHHRTDVVSWLGNGLAALLSVFAIAAGVIGMLVAFGVIGDSGSPFEDGMACLIAGVVLSLAANVFRREHRLISGASAPRGVGGERAVVGDRARAEDGRAHPRDIKDIRGMIVVSTDEARDVGTVKDVLFDPSEMAVLALVVAPADVKDGRMFVEREHVRGFGRDAVTIRSESTMRAFATRGREREFADGGVRLDGVRVMTERGDDVGKVGKVLINDDCRIVRVEAGGGMFGRRRRFDAGDIVSVGRERLIVSRGRER
jgi:uncharacterized protein YrrD